MKRTITLYCVLFITAIIAFYGCRQDGSDPTAAENRQLVAVGYDISSNYILPAYNAEEDIIPASIESECLMRTDSGRMEFRKQRGLFLGFIFRKMQLDSLQMRQLREYISSYNNCVLESNRLTTVQIREIIRNANLKRREVIALLKSGAISREEANTRIEQINKRVREALAGNVDAEARCRCLKQLFEQIYPSLTEQQKQIWDEWVLTLRGPCFQ